MNRYTPEQHIWLSFLRKRFPVRFDYQWDITPDSIAGTERSFASNLIIVSPAQAGIVFAKYRPPSLSGGALDWVMHGSASCYTHGMWKDAYQRICLGKDRSLGPGHRLRLAAIRSSYHLLSRMQDVRSRIAKLRGRTQ